MPSLREWVMRRREWKRRSGDWCHGRHCCCHRSGPPVVIMEGAQGIPYRAGVVRLAYVRWKNRCWRAKNSRCLLALFPFSATVLKPNLKSQQVKKMNQPRCQKILLGSSWLDIYGTTKISQPLAIFLLQFCYFCVISVEDRSKISFPAFLRSSLPIILCEGFFLFFTEASLLIDHFKVVSLGGWPLNEIKAGGDLVWIETSRFSYVNDAVLVLISKKYDCSGNTINSRSSRYNLQAIFSEPIKLMFMTISVVVWSLHKLSRFCIIF